MPRVPLSNKGVRFLDTLINFRVGGYSPTKPESGSITTIRQSSLRAKAIFASTDFEESSSIPEPYECTPSLLSSVCTRPLISSRIALTSSIGNPFGSRSGQSSRRKPGT
jgi:hypothetical protein